MTPKQKAIIEFKKDCKYFSTKINIEPYLHTALQEQAKQKANIILSILKQPNKKSVEVCKEIHHEILKWVGK